jgi:hypothetical protein
MVLENKKWIEPHLDKPDCSCLFTEALTADIHSVFADDTTLVSADAAVNPEECN